MKAGLILGLLYAGAITTGLAAEPIDLMGVSIGMPMTELTSLFQAKKWHCDQIGQTGFRCRLPQDAGASAQDIAIRVASALPTKPVASMRVAFSSSDNPIPSLMQKFGPPNIVHGADANWHFSNGSWLELESGGTDRVLLLSDPDLIKANAEAERKLAAPYSSPKF